MISPTQITNFNRTDRELQVFWLFCICVAGKNSDQTAAKIGKLIQTNVPDDILPFEWLKQNEHAIHNVLVANRIGQYGRIGQAIRESLGFDMRTVTLEQLESIHGIGGKTSRFFLLHTRPNAGCAVLDTHILKWMASICPDMDIPKATPPPSKYKTLEKLFINLAQSYYPGMSIADVDLLIWSKMSGRMEAE